MNSKYRALIAELRSDIIELGSSCEGEMAKKNLIKYYERDLARAGFNLERVRRTADGRYKVSTPKQICKSRLEDLYAALWEYYYSGTFESVYKRWAAAYQADYVDAGHREQSTLDRYAADYERFIAGTELDGKQITEVRRSDLKKFYMGISAGASITRRCLNNVKSLVNAVFVYAADELDMDVISARGVDTRALNLREPDEESVYTREEHDAIMEYAWKKIQSSVYARAVSLMGRLNVRVGEVRALTWADVDFEGATVRIEKQLVNRDGGFKVREPKGCARSSSRTEPLTPQALEVLRLQREKNPGDGLVFVKDGGGQVPIDDDAVNCALRRYCAALGIEYKSSHKFRFFAVSEGRAAGLTADQTKKMAGHDSLAMNDHYDRRRAGAGVAVDHETWAKIVDVPQNGGVYQTVPSPEKGKGPGNG